MTAQIADSFTYKGEQYSLAGRNGQGLFDPEDHGMQPVGKCSACWRGYVCGYRVDEQALWLDTLEVYLDSPAPELFGAKPSSGGGFLSFDAVYQGLNHKVPYTGGLLLAKGFIQELYVHMGFHPAWKFREVHELIFEKGDLVRALDRSKEIAEFRDEIAGRPLRPDLEEGPEELQKWIERCFCQDYKW